MTTADMPPDPFGPTTDLTCTAQDLTGPAAVLLPALITTTPPTPFVLTGWAESAQPHRHGGTIIRGQLEYTHAGVTTRGLRLYRLPNNTPITVITGGRA